MKSDLFEVDPLSRARALASSGGCQLIDQLLTTLHLPADQPLVASGLLCMAECIVEYATTLPACKAEFSAIVEEANGLAVLLREHAHQIQGIAPPRAQLHRRAGTYPAWALFTSLHPSQQPLRMAAGGATVLSLLTKSTLSGAYCTSLRRDQRILGIPADSQPQADDLAAQRFGAAWMPRYKKIDAEVRRRVLLAPPPGGREDRSAGETLIGLLRHKFEYLNLDQRRGVACDAHLTPEQMRRATARLKVEVEAGNSESTLVAMALIPGLTCRATATIPIIHQLDELCGVGLDLRHGWLAVDLCRLFPNRQPSPHPGANEFEPSGDVLQLPLPAFLLRALRARLAENPEAASVGDLLNCSVMTGRDRLIEEEVAVFAASVARLRRTMPLVALNVTHNRLVAAAVTLDFSLIGSARMYYARLSGSEIIEACTSLFSEIGWNLMTNQTAPPDVGSRVVPTHGYLTQQFTAQAERCRENWPGRRGSLNALLSHHVHFSRYTAGLLAFCVGARETTVYDIKANQLGFDQRALVLHDKARNDPSRAMMVPLNTICMEQIRQWFAHCEALAARLRNFSDSEAVRMRLALEQVCARAAVHAIPMPRPNRAPSGIGSSDVFGPAFKMPGNVGRHFWQNALRRHGLSSFDVDRFMRHQVVGLETMCTSATEPPGHGLDRIRKAQDSVLTEIGIEPISGLRRAA